METGIPDAAMIAAHGCVVPKDVEPEETATLSIPDKGSTAAWSPLALHDQIHWRKTRLLSTDEYKTFAKKWYYRPELEALRHVEPTKALLLDALHHFGIATLLGIDEVDSQNAITPYQASGFHGK